MPLRQAHADFSRGPGQAIRRGHYGRVPGKNVVLRPDNAFHSFWGVIGLEEAGLELKPDLREAFVCRRMRLL